MPTDANPMNTMHFTDIEKQLPLPFWFVADFESILKLIDTVPTEVPAPDRPVRDDDGNLRFSKNRNGDPEQGMRATSITTRIQEHVPCGFSYQLLSVDPRFYEPPVIVRSEHYAQDFIQRLHTDAKRIREWLSHEAPSSAQPANVCRNDDASFIRTSDLYATTG